MFFYLNFVLLSVAFVDRTLSNTQSQDCMRSNGVEYRGKQQSSSTGRTCLNWTNTTRDYDVTSHTDTETGLGDHNYCRNPDSSEKPWCYVVGPDGITLRQSCIIDICKDQVPTVAAEANDLRLGVSTVQTRIFEDTKSGASQGEGAAVQPVVGISQRVQTGPKKKKDLGTMGYVMAILMMGMIVVLGVGITVGYFYKRGRDLKRQHDERVYEREMQRITLPLSAFSNPACELVDENTIIIMADQTPVQEGEEGAGGDPLMGQQQAVTPGA